MDIVNSLPTIAAIAISISLFLALFLLGIKTSHKLSNRLFALFLILAAIDLSLMLDDFLGIPLSIRVFISSFFFLQLPVFYLYVLSVCYADFKLKPIHLIHALPFMVSNLVLLPSFYTADLGTKVNFLSKGGSQAEILFNHTLVHVQCVFYIAAAFMALRKAKKIYLENYAGTSITSINWLFQFTTALSAFFIIALLKNIFKFTDYPTISEWLKVALILCELVIIFWYLYKALNNPGLFRNIDSKLRLVSEIIAEEKNGIHATLDDIGQSTALLTLKNHMLEKKPFLNPSVTIQEISKDIEIPVRELSVLINHNLGQHFYDFVNSYRIAYAIDSLNDVTKSKVTVLEILYAAGFNSKSSFNTAFKKQTGKTPTQYRNSLIHSNL